MKNVLVWGASGGTDQAILIKLKNDDRTIIAVARETKLITSFADHVFEILFGDPGRAGLEAFVVALSKEERKKHITLNWCE
jgi:hypothetical protein